MTDAQAAPAFTLNPLAVTGVGLLRAVRDGGWATKTELAEAAGRLVANISRDIAAYAKAGLISDDARALTQEGGAQLAAIERAERGEPGSRAAEGQGDILFLRHAQIVPDPANARRDWDSEDAVDDLDALREDILQNGLLQNLLVTGPVEPPTKIILGDAIRAALPEGTPLYQLAGGERRWRAIYSAIVHGDWDPDRLLPCKRLEPEDDVQLRIVALSENLQRRDLNPIEKARGFEGLAAAGLSNADIAERFGKTPEHVQQHRAFLTLNEADQARLTLPRDDPRRLTVRQARELVAQRNKAAAPPPELGVSPEARLLAAEILHALRVRAGYTWDDLAIGAPALTDPVLAELVEKSFVHKPALRLYGDHAGLWVIRLSYAFETRAFPGLTGETADAAIADEWARAGRDAPAEAGAYLTDWLNGPFDITAEGQAALDAQAAEDAAQGAARARADEERETLRATHARVAERARILFETARATTAAGGVDRDVVTEIATSSDAPLPWRMTAGGGVAAADGTAIFHPANHAAADRSSARLRLMVLAVNAAAGLETPEDEQPESEPEADPDDEDQDDGQDDQEGEED